MRKWSIDVLVLGLILIAVVVVSRGFHRREPMRMTDYPGVNCCSPVAMALDTFWLSMGRYPRDLNELTSRPADEQEAARWDGPYLEDPKSLQDSWANPIHYRSPGLKNKLTYDLWSYGPDGQEGTNDDIANFNHGPSDGEK